MVIMVVVVGVLTLGLGVPLAGIFAQATQQELFIDRLTDTTYYASLAERPLTAADTVGLEAELARYDDIYGVAVVVLDRAGRTLASSRYPVPDLSAEEHRERIDLAMANQSSESYPLLMPWDDRLLVLAEPVLVDTDVQGVVITVSTTTEVRALELRVWTLVALASVFALGLGVMVALPVVRWILRPVRRLDEGTGRVAAAVLAGHGPDPVSDGSGPPELRRLSASFDRMAQQVTDAYTAQRSFVADASHQLRNPLTALRLRLSNLHGHVDDDAADEHIGALEEAERLSTLLDGLLALARTERAVPLVEIDVDHGIDDRLEAWRALAEHGGLRLDRVGTRGLRAVAQSGAVETVLDAVLDNAVKFTPPGGVITVGVVATAAHVELGVHDTGPGIAPDELDRATDRFWRSPEQSNVDGSGLGLAIASRTVELAGGELHLELPRAGGLRVVARLPRHGANHVSAHDPRP